MAEEMNPAWAETLDTRRKRDAGLLYVDARLTAWAHWARDNRNNLGYPTVSLLYKAMQQTKVGIVRLPDSGGLTARGEQAHVMRAGGHGVIPDAVEEIDRIVARLRPELHKVVVANYFVYGPIEARAKSVGYRRARFFQLLESAKYCVFVALDTCV